MEQLTSAFQGLKCTLQDLEAVKRAMQDVNGDGSLRPDEADHRRQLLLNQFYGVSGDAKAQPAATHINDLLEKGATRSHTCSALFRGRF